MTAGSVSDGDRSSAGCMHLCPGHSNWYRESTVRSLMFF